MIPNPVTSKNLFESSIFLRFSCLRFYYSLYIFNLLCLKDFWKSFISMSMFTMWIFPRKSLCVCACMHACICVCCCCFEAYYVQTSDSPSFCLSFMWWDYQQRLLWLYLAFMNNIAPLTIPLFLLHTAQISRFLFVFTQAYIM